MHAVPCNPYNYESERVGEFKYLGSLITENSDNNTDIKARIMAGNRSYYSVLPLLRSKALSRTTNKIVQNNNKISGAVWLRSMVFNGR